MADMKGSKYAGSTTMADLRAEYGQATTSATLGWRKLQYIGQLLRYPKLKNHATLGNVYYEEMQKLRGDPEKEPDDSVKGRPFLTWRKQCEELVTQMLRANKDTRYQALTSEDTGTNMLLASDLAQNRSKWKEAMMAWAEAKSEEDMLEQYRWRHADPEDRAAKFMEVYTKTKGPTWAEAQVQRANQKAEAARASKRARSSDQPTPPPTKCRTGHRACRLAMEST